MAEKTQRNNILLAFLTLLGVTAGVSIIGLFTLRKDSEIIQGQAEATEYRVPLINSPSFWKDTALA